MTGRFIIHQINAMTVIAALCMTASRSAAQEPQPADKTIEAAGYVDQAELDLKCSPEGSIAWANKAIDTLKTVNKQKDTAALAFEQNLRTGAADVISEAEARIAELKSTAPRVESMMKEARLETAEKMLRDVDPQACYAGFNPLRYELDQRMARSVDYVRQGELFAKLKPSKAASLYRKAEAINRESPLVAQKFAELSKR